MTLKTRSNLRRATLAAALLGLAGPAFAQMGPPPGQGGGPPPPPPQHKHHHHGDVGAGIAAGVLGGLAGAALANGQGAPPPPGYGYPPPPPPPPPPGPRYGAYDADDEVECRIVRKPVYDEDGEVVSYRTRRICQ